MSRFPFEFPDINTLEVGIGHVLGSNKTVVTGRKQNPHASTYASEIVSCRLDNGTELQFLCKYSSKGFISHGHRGDLEYEAAIYQQVLSPSASSAPKFFGVYRDKINSRLWLIIEYLDKSINASKAPMVINDEGALAPIAMYLAARWAASFHATHEVGHEKVTMGFLIKYDADYYRGWAHRVMEFAEHSRLKAPWLKAACQRFDDLIPVLLTPPLTIIHGEYYPTNILFRDGVIYPVDWQSAAVGQGEIDLATLQDGWKEKYARNFEMEYLKVRWPKGVPAGFKDKLEAARFYIQLRWLGQRGIWDSLSHRRGHLRRLQTLALNTNYYQSVTDQGKIY